MALPASAATLVADSAAPPPTPLRCLSHNLCSLPPLQTQNKSELYKATTRSRTFFSVSVRRALHASVQTAGETLEKTEQLPQKRALRVGAFLEAPCGKCLCVPVLPSFPGTSDGAGEERSAGSGVLMQAQEEEGPPCE